MKETTLRRFFEGSAGAYELAQDVAGMLVQVGPIEWEARIEDMACGFEIERSHLQRLLAACLSGVLPYDALRGIAFAILSSDAFELEDEVLSEVIFDCSCPEVNFPLNEETARMHGRWLSGESVIPERVKAPSNGRLVSVLRKVSVSS